MPELRWYVADVSTNGPAIPEWEQAAPAVVPDTAALLERLAKIDQLESGIFVGVPVNIQDPMFRNGGLWTEDEEFADLGDAIIEIRAFDTAYITVASSDARLVECIDRSLPPE